MRSVFLTLPEKCAHPRHIPVINRNITSPNLCKLHWTYSYLSSYSCLLCVCSLFVLIQRDSVFSDLPLYFWFSFNIFVWIVGFEAATLQRQVCYHGTRVETRVSFVRNSRDFHAKRVSYFVKKCSLFREISWKDYLHPTLPPPPRRFGPVDFAQCRVESGWCVGSECVVWWVCCVVSVWCVCVWW